MTVFQMGNNHSTSRQTPLRCILDNWKLFDPLALRRSHLKFFCATYCVATISTGRRGTLSWGWDFKLQYHPAARIILRKTREMDRDPLCPNFLSTKRYAWKIPWMEEPGRLQSMGSRRVGHDWVTSLSLSTFLHWRRKWQPTPVFLPGESQGRRSLVGCRLWGHTELDTTEAT